MCQTQMQGTVGMRPLWSLWFRQCNKAEGVKVLMDANRDRAPTFNQRAFLGQPIVK